MSDAQNEPLSRDDLRKLVASHFDRHRDHLDQPDAPAVPDAPN